MGWNRKRLGFITKPPFFYSLSIFFFFLSTAFRSTVNSCPDNRPCSLSAKARSRYFQEPKKPVEKIMIMPREAREVVTMMNSGRRHLGRIGSLPPMCLSKCGNCTPCKPVHVPVQPGTPVTAEYYPEAWRCKCGNKLYMP